VGGDFMLAILRWRKRLNKLDVGIKASAWRSDVFF
jgi:hypothetical protein